jgi:hypothetical protein
MGCAVGVGYGVGAAEPLRISGKNSVFAAVSCELSISMVKTMIAATAIMALMRLWCG